MPVEKKWKRERVSNMISKMYHVFSETLLLCLTYQVTRDTINKK